MSYAECIIIQRTLGETLRQWLIKNTLLNRNFRILADKDSLIFPLVRKLTPNEKQTLRSLFLNIRFEQRELIPTVPKKPIDLFSAIKPKIPVKLHKFIPKSFDIIGNLILIEIPKELEPYERTIGTTLIDLHPSIRGVFKKAEAIKGEFRLRNIKHIAGDTNSITIHRENKCVYELDIKKVYFSPRLATEHLRICGKVLSGEKVLDMFAGVGPFSILIAKRKKVNVCAIDINPNAVYFLKRNIKRNKVEEFITVREGDARNVLKGVDNTFHRIIMNLPMKASQFLDIACQVLKPNGIIHFYQFAEETEIPKMTVKKLSRLIERNNRKIKKMLEIRKVRAYAPYIWQIGVDICVK
ncbi:MAG: class I SAM-dependent methyltransferase [Candidatus Helarchaeota archaeon]